MNPSDRSRTPAPGGRLLMIGRRKGAIAAAQRCGWEPVVIDVPPRSEQAPDAFGGTAQWALDEASRLFPDKPPIAVAAVATGSVVAAAVVRELFGLPGISRETALRCHDKLVMKKAIAAAGIPCAPWQETSADTTADELIAALGLPLILKLPISSGGRGVWVCQTPAEVAALLRPGLLAEGFVRGTEMSIETFRAGSTTLFRNPTRYLEPRWANVLPAELAAADSASIATLGERVHDTLGITSGISHMEIFLGEDGPVFGEIAARPPGGFIMDLIRRAYGFDPWETVLRLATGETPELPAAPRQFAGAWLLHPGAGAVAAISGRQQTLEIPHIVGLSCQLEPGDLVTPRIGSGESKGRITAEAPTHQACCAALQQASATLKITLTEKFVRC